MRGLDVRVICGLSCWLILAPILDCHAARRPRPTVAQKLIDVLHDGYDPLDAPINVEVHQQLGEWRESLSVTHLTCEDVNILLDIAPQPVSLWLELGAFVGGSAMEVARRAKDRYLGSCQCDGGRRRYCRTWRNGRRTGDTDPEEPPLRQLPEDEVLPPDITTVVAVDAFICDAYMLWLAPRDSFCRKIKAQDGSIGLYNYFRANVVEQGHSDLVLPLQATTLSALQLVTNLTAEGIIPSPQVIYLDSAHLVGEVFLEMQRAWEVLVPGGILAGDDWLISTVQPDVVKFASLYEAELDETVAEQAWPLRILGRTQKGLYVTYRSFQWMLRKRFDVEAVRSTTASSAAVHGGTAAHPDFRYSTKHDLDCWTSGWRNLQLTS